ncbi:MAG: hypothetical protein WKF51_14515, partial [Geodermatophilaceae bacterium]
RLLRTISRVRGAPAPESTEQATTVGPRRAFSERGEYGQAGQFWPLKFDGRPWDDDDPLSRA